jgi:Sulfotransferase domain
MSTRLLDFIVIGTQKGGTTSLWQYLRGHPSIYLPEDKEAPFFFTSAATEPEGLGAYMALHFAAAPPGALLGKVTPHYMMGNNHMSTDLIARKIAEALPDVRIIALLRDPVERAISHYRMSVRRGIESRSFDEMTRELLSPARLSVAREAPTETTSYLVQGEYGRILAGYLRHISSARMHVEFSEDLARDPAGVIDRVLAFIGLEPGHRPVDLGRRYHRGGLSRRVDDEAEQQLRAFLREQVWGRLGENSERIQHAFNFFFETWNIVADDRLPEVSEQSRELLEEHYAGDAELLARLGIQVPWLTTWSMRVDADTEP